MRQMKISKQITNRESEALDKYLQEIGRFELISADEEVDLAEKIRRGDEASLNKLVQVNLRFVVSVAKQYQNQGLSLPDLINEGNLGLIKGAKRFDETRGFKFISYAVWWIRQSILQALAEQSRIVRLPLNKVGSLNKINKVSQRLEQEYEREPTADEIAAVLELLPEDVEESLLFRIRPFSMDATLPSSTGGDFENNLHDVMPSDNPSPEQGLLNRSLSTEIMRALKHITKSEADVVKLYFGLEGGDPLTLDEIGERFHLTRERIRQIKEKALRKLKHSSRSKLLKTYLG